MGSTFTATSTSTAAVNVKAQVDLNGAMRLRQAPTPVRSTPLDPAPRAGRSRRAAVLCSFAAVAVLAACGRVTLLPEHGHPPPEVQEACHRTEARCSSCHTLDRILNADHRGRTQWERLVTQMRLRPGSGIPIADTDVIVSCLMYIDTIRPRADREIIEPHDRLPAGSASFSGLRGAWCATSRESTR
jgi:hypothetical protein